MEALIQAAQKEVLDSYRREFDFLSSHLRDLDGKAQGTTAISGAFLTVGLALLNRAGGLKGNWSRATLTFAVLELAVAIFFCLQALRIRKVLSCPSGHETAKLLTTIRDQATEEIATRLLYFYGDTADLWKSCVNARRVAATRKARLIWIAQTSLAISLLFVASLVIETILFN